MEHISESLLEYIDTEDSIEAAFLRYCLSDKLPLNLSSVISGTMSPVVYASKIIASGYKEIDQKFFTDPETVTAIPKILKTARAFDGLVMNAALVRSLTMRPRELVDSVDVIVNAGLFLLSLDSAQHRMSHYSGLIDFDEVIQSYITHKKKYFYTGNIELLSKLGRSVGNMSEAHWILHDPLWQKVLLHKREKLRIFRLFLYVAAASYSLDDDTIGVLFEVERAQVFPLINEFIDLRENTQTTKEDIESFLYAVSLFSYDANHNFFLAALVGGSFDMFRTVHDRAFGDQFRNVLTR